MGMNYQLNAGVMFNQYIGVEANYTDNGGYTASQDNSKITAKSYGASLKVAYPFSGSVFSIYGKLGFASQTLKTTDSYFLNGMVNSSGIGLGLGLGLGVGYQFLPNLQGTVEYNSTTASTSGIDLTLGMFGLGLNYSF